MRKEARQKIAILGCGNLAWHLAKQLQSIDRYEIWVYNHQSNPQLIDFQLKLKCQIEATFENIIQDAAFYFVCVSDRSIAHSAEMIKTGNPNAVLMHTSGSAKLKELGDRIHGTGVFYPVQSFSRADVIDWNHLPVIIEASDKETEKKIRKLASLLTEKVISLSQKDRIKLHLSAVLVNNFSNALYAAAENFLNNNTEEANFKLLVPLIQKTTEKLRTLSPLHAQTGPAKRGDEEVMKKHLKLLQKENDLKKIYKLISSLIDKQQNG